ncbi:hypothetical protein TNCV_2946111 [Trichonephila clavipes]|nr:hypothetical protein TNCV_2946111 [Trichonephila clavipes]
MRDLNALPKRSVTGFYPVFPPNPLGESLGSNLSSPPTNLDRVDEEMVSPGVPQKSLKSRLDQGLEGLKSLFSRIADTSSKTNPHSRAPR